MAVTKPQPGEEAPTGILREVCKLIQFFWPPEITHSCYSHTPNELFLMPEQTALTQANQVYDFKLSNLTPGKTYNVRIRAAFVSRTGIVTEYTWPKNMVTVHYMYVAVFSYSSQPLCQSLKDCFAFNATRHTDRTIPRGRRHSCMERGWRSSTLPIGRAKGEPKLQVCNA